MNFNLQFLKKLIRLSAIFLFVWSGLLERGVVRLVVSSFRDAPARENLVTQLIAFRAQSCNQHSNLPDGQLSIAVPIKILTLISILHKFYLHSRSCNQWTVILYMSMGSWCHL